MAPFFILCRAWNKNASRVNQYKWLTLPLKAATSEVATLEYEALLLHALPHLGRWM